MNESHYGDNIPLIVEPIGADDCTALSLIKVAFSQKKILYDVDTLWNATPQSNGGANPVDTVLTAIKNGLFNKTMNVFDKLWTGYFSATIGIGDSFSMGQAAMTAAQSSCMINGYWYENWNTVGALEIMPKGDVVVSDHSFVFVDWTTVNGQLMAIIDAHQGYRLFMPRDVFNDEMSKQGCSALMPSNPTINAARSKDLLQWINFLWIEVKFLMAKLSTS